LVVATADNPLS